MKEQGNGWFQRWVGKDGQPSPELLRAVERVSQLEDDLAHEQTRVEALTVELTERGKQLGGARHSLEQEQERVRLRDYKLEQLEQLEQKTRSTVQELQARLAEQKAAFDKQQSDALQRLTAEHGQALARVRATHSREVQALREELSLLTKASASLKLENEQLAQTLATTNDRSTQADRALQELRDQNQELRNQVLKHTYDVQTAQARLQQVERHASACAAELEACQRRSKDLDSRAASLQQESRAQALKLQRLEERASLLEHELVQTKVARESAESSTSELRRKVHALEAEGPKLAQAEARLQAATQSVGELEVRVRCYSSLLHDLWRALENSIGSAAPLALSLGIELDAPKLLAQPVAAGSALQHALRKRLWTLNATVEEQSRGVSVTLDVADAPRDDAGQWWLAIFSAKFLGSALGLDLRPRTKTLAGSSLTIELGATTLNAADAR
jgi:chromosome segregation ATPase